LAFLNLFKSPNPPMRPIYSRIQCIAIGFAVFLVTSFAVAEPILTPKILVDLAHVLDVELSPDGDRIAYTILVQRNEEDDPGPAFSELWVTAKGQPQRRLAGLGENISNLLWSPDGETISFLSDRSVGDKEKDTLFVMPSEGGKVVSQIDVDGSIEFYSWSPDGEKIVFTVKDEKSDEEKENLKKGKDWTVFDHDYKFRRLWLFDVQTGDISRIQDQDLDVASFEWMPDSKSIIFQAASVPRIDAEYMFSRIYSMSLGDQAQLLTDTTGAIGHISISPDGDNLAFLSAVSLNDPLAQSLFLVPATGGNARNLTVAYEGSVSLLTWLDDRTILMVADEGGSQAIWEIDVPSGSRRQIAWPALIISDIDSVPNHKAIAIAANSAAHPDEVFVFERGTPPVRISQHNPVLDGINLARQEIVEWDGEGGLRITGILTYPLVYQEGKRYPLVLQVHGGPEGVSQNGWTTKEFDLVQLLAARGYMVLQPNYRGSAGRGVAFSKGVHNDIGGKEIDDILLGIDSLADKGLINPKRVGIGGSSYGGFVSALAATRHSERFRAAVVAAGVTNWISFSGTTDIPYEMSLVHWNSWWQEATDLHWQRSPMAHMKGANTPTLIVHGTADERVHPEQSLELYRALRIKGVPTQLVFYPREPHEFGERAHQLDYAYRALDWFDTHLAQRTQLSLDDFITSQMQNAHIPGFAGAIVVGDQVVWAKGFGQADFTNGRPVTADTIFVLASVSKTMTATALMLAVESGKLGLDDDLNRHLPFHLDNPKVDGEVITPRHLATHMSGILDSDAVYGSELNYYRGGDNPIKLGEFLREYLVSEGRFYDRQQNFGDYRPGDRWNYSNIGAGLAGYLLERTTGMSLDRYCEHNIFKPLGMSSTSWHIADADMSRHAIPYYNENGRYVAYPHYGLATWPDGGLRTTVNDLGRFLAMIMQDGQFNGDTILESDTVDEMLKTQTRSVEGGQELQDVSEQEPPQSIFWYGRSAKIYRTYRQ